MYVMCGEIVDLEFFPPITCSMVIKVSWEVGKHLRKSQCSCVLWTEKLVDGDGVLLRSFSMLFS